MPSAPGAISNWSVVNEGDFLSQLLPSLQPEGIGAPAWGANKARGAAGGIGVSSAWQW